MSDKDKLFIILSILNETKHRINKAIAESDFGFLVDTGINPFGSKPIIDYIFNQIEERTK